MAGRCSGWRCSTANGMAGVQDETQKLVVHIKCGCEGPRDRTLNLILSKVESTQKALRTALHPKFSG